MELLTAAEMREIEAKAIAAGGASGLELMARAGRGLVEAVMDWRPDFARAPSRAAVLCGPGNNGGDGFVVARLLKEQGWEVDLFAEGIAGRLAGGAAEMRRHWLEIGTVAPLAKAFANGATLYDLVIDALFGIGLSRPLENVARDCARLSRRVLGASGVLVAVDAPSGLCADSGRPLGGDEGAFRADLTVTFHREKRGHRLDRGPEFCGAVRVVDIGLRGAPPNAARLFAPRHSAVTKAGGHKYSYGHALVLAGGVGKGGAARLAARGALRVGAGLVTIGPPPAALIENAARLDAIMLRAIKDADALRDTLADERINVVVLGPGLGVSERTRSMVETALKAPRRAVVLDADALSAFAEAPEALFELTRGREVVMTPHMGEFARLFPRIGEKSSAQANSGPAFSRLDAAEAAADSAGCVVLLKGADTIVAAPGAAPVVVSGAYERSCPWLATAGSGDVLAGMIGGLFARGLDAGEAAATAAWLHQEAARSFGPGLIAEDLPEALPAVLRALGADQPPRRHGRNAGVRAAHSA
ncbi:MAG: NAD(P)H-hydrate dehydratase [Paracoccaceae bacterium]